MVELVELMLREMRKEKRKKRKQRKIGRLLEMRKARVMVYHAIAANPNRR